jgi:hypothetical protein
MAEAQPQVYMVLHKQPKGKLISRPAKAQISPARLVV